MNVLAIAQLRDLRQLRERRAAHALAVQQQRYEQAMSALQQARDEARAADALVQEKADELQQLLCAGALPVATCRTALDTLDEFEAWRSLLASKLLEAEARVGAEDERRNDLQRQLYNRQRQCEALEPLLRQQQLSDRRAAEVREESLGDDSRPVLPGGME